MRGLRVMMPARHSPAACTVGSVSSPRAGTAAATFCSSSWLSNGLVRKPNTPRCVRRHRVGDRAVRGQDDDRQRRMLAMDRVEQLPGRRCPASCRSVITAAGPRDRERRERGLAAVGGAHAIAGGRQPQADQLQQIGIVVDQKDVACDGSSLSFHRTVAVRCRHRRRRRAACVATRSRSRLRSTRTQLIELLHCAARAFFLLLRAPRAAARRSARAAPPRAA